MRRIFIILSAVVLALPATAQNNPTQNDTAQDNRVQSKVVDYTRPGRYVVGDVTVSGAKIADPIALGESVGIFVGDTITIPGSYISSAIRQLLTIRRYTYADISAEVIDGDRVNLDIFLTPTPRVSEWKFRGIRSGQAATLKGKDYMDLRVGNNASLSDYDITRHTNYIKNYYKEKGFRNTTVEVLTEEDTRYPGSGLVIVTFVVDRGPKVRIGKINFEGNEAFSDRRLRRTFKKTHQMGLNFFRNFRLKDKEYETDRDVNLIDFYNSKGYRNATVLSDSIYRINDRRLGINVSLFEGNEYFFRNVRFVGNTIFATESTENRKGLAEILDIEKGDRYDRKSLYKRLGVGGEGGPDESNVNSLYKNSGYLTASIEPVENVVGRDSIDLEVKIFEGKPFTVNNIDIRGNTQVDDEVIRREIDVRPGELYSEGLVMQTIRRLGAMGHFDEAAMIPSITPVSDNLVDIGWNLVPKGSDEINVSGGWGAGSFIGSVTLNLRNLSSRRLFDKGAWRPYPRGQNQTLGLHAQTNGQYYKAFAISFTEPWLGGKKPVSLSVSTHFSDETTGAFLLQKTNDYFRTFGVSAGMGRRLSWPDHNFELYNELSYTAYMLKNWGDYFIMSNGRSNIFALNTMLSRNALDGWSIFPTGGSRFSLSLTLTPPFSLMDGKDYKDPNMTENERYRWIEYHKWRFSWDWYTPLSANNKLILRTAFEMGYLGHYNPDKLSPFEGFEMGGSGVSGYNMYGVDIVGMRGYDEGALTPIPTRRGDYARVFNKYTAEVRYPLVMQGSTQIFGLIFAEGGNAFRSWKEYDPFRIKRAAGAGIRITLPMIGMLGLDWGYGFDAPAGAPRRHGPQLTFTFGQQY